MAAPTTRHQHYVVASGGWRAKGIIFFLVLAGSSLLLLVSRPMSDLKQYTMSIEDEDDSPLYAADNPAIAATFNASTIDAKYSEDKNSTLFLLVSNSAAPGPISFQADHEDPRTMISPTMIMALKDGGGSPWINETIRRWGCHRTETPVVFVHIGKAGGGLIRARFAAAALDYNRTKWYFPKDDQHFYPILSGAAAANGSSAKGKFCNSQYSNFMIPNSQIWKKSFEGNQPCNATTPIGMALACPESKLRSRRRNKRCLGCDDWRTSQTCHTVYVGHNWFGTEFHWLPPLYLHNWWRSTPWNSNNNDDETALLFNWKGIYEGDYSWCGNHRRPTSYKIYRALFEKCSVPIGEEIDAKFQTFWRHQLAQQSSMTTPLIDHDTTSSNNNKATPLNYSPIYASLPLQRVTMVREPWSWLISKFFWHKNRHHPECVCDNVSQLPVWAPTYAIEYIGYLCGSDCIIRYERNLITWEELWIQAESNLRHSFSVIGLLNETATFYEMVSTRIAFVDMNRNPGVKGSVHGTEKNGESKRCSKVFQGDEDFRASMREVVPALRVMERLYEVAVQVNRFQLKELRECQGPRGSLWFNEEHFHQ